MITTSRDAVPELVVVLEGGTERRTPIQAEVTLGRDPTNSLPLDDGYLSRRHCKVVRRAERVSVVDLRSYNGTFVNGQRIHEECFLLPGDVVRIGRTTLYVDFREEDGESVRVHVPDQKVGREGVEPVVRAKPPMVSQTYRDLAEGVPFGPRVASTTTHPDERTRQQPRASRNELREKKTPVPRPAIEESAVARSGNDARTSASGGTKPPTTISRDREGLRVISQIARVLPGVEDEAEFLDYVLGKVLEVIPAERGVLMRLDPSGRGLYPASVRNALPGRDDRAARRQGLSHTIAKKVVRERVSVLVDDAKIDERFKGSSSIQDLEIRSILATPIWLGEQVSGLIYLDHLMHSHVFSEADRELVVAVANLVALGLQKGKKT